MPAPISLRVRVSHVSLETLSEAGWEPGDNGAGEHPLFELGATDQVLACLTKRQRQVVTILAQGYTRRETADQLGISLQAIHQIVPRMRKRLATYARP